MKFLSILTLAGLALASGPDVPAQQTLIDVEIGLSGDGPALTFRDEGSGQRTVSWYGFPSLPSPPTLGATGGSARGANGMSMVQRDAAGNILTSPLPFNGDGSATMDDDAEEVDVGGDDGSGTSSGDSVGIAQSPGGGASDPGGDAQAPPSGPGGGSILDNGLKGHAAGTSGPDGKKEYGGAVNFWCFAPGYSSADDRGFILARMSGHDVATAYDAVSAVLAAGPGSVIPADVSIEAMIKLEVSGSDLIVRAYREGAIDGLVVSIDGAPLADLASGSNVVVSQPGNGWECVEATLAGAQALLGSGSSLRVDEAHDGAIDGLVASFDL